MRSSLWPQQHMPSTFLVKSSKFCNSCEMNDSAYDLVTKWEGTRGRPATTRPQHQLPRQALQALQAELPNSLHTSPPARSQLKQLCCQNPSITQSLPAAEIIPATQAASSDSPKQHRDLAWGNKINCLLPPRHLPRGVSLTGGLQEA